MAESLILPKTADRATLYAAVVPQIAALVAHETDLTANLANIAAALRETFGWFWIGFYIKKENELVLAPFQGQVACTRIALHRGVCGHAYTTQKTVIVPNVEAFPGHIACSSASKSEIVLPAFDKNGDVFLVLDVDSDKLNDFSEIDADGLAQVMRIIETF